MQNASGKVAQSQARAARRFLRFQNRTSLIKCVEAVRHLEKIICQNIRTKIVQHLRDDFRELTKALCESDFGRTAESQLIDLWCGFVGFTENRANSDRNSTRLNSSHVKISYA